MVNIKGTLPVGIKFNGETHTDFILRTQTLRDTRSALSAVGKNDDVGFMAEVYRRRLVQIGTIPEEKITLDMILDIDQIDFEALEKAAADLKKNMLNGSGESSGVGKDNAVFTENGTTV